MRNAGICLAILAVFTFAVPPVQAKPQRDRHVIILGVDGLKPANLKRYLTNSKYATARAKGFLSQMLGTSHGVLTPKRTVAIFPSYTWPAWTTIFTGHFPGRHGVMGQTWLLRDRSKYYSAFRNFVDGPTAYGLAFDTQGGQRKLDAIIGKFPRLARGALRKALSFLESQIAKKAEGFSFAKMLGDLVPRGHSQVTSASFVPTVYDYALRSGLSIHNVYNFVHHKSAPAGVPRGFSRPTKDVLFRIGLGDALGKHLAGGWLEKTIRKAVGLLSWFKRYANYLDPILAPLRRYTKSELLRSLSPLEERYANQVRGHIYHDQLAVDKAIKLVQTWKRLPNLMNVYQNAPDACSHGAKGWLPDVQAACLGHFDRNTKRFIDALKRHHPRAWNNILFVLVSDHGHTTLTASKLMTGDTSLKALKAGGASSCDYIEAQNGAMSHIYFVSRKNAIDPFKRPFCFPRGISAMYQRSSKASSVAAKIAANPSQVPAGFAAIYARGVDGKYRVYYARSARTGKVYTWKQGLSLRDFSRDAAYRAVGFTYAWLRVAAMNNKKRSGDIIFVTDARSGYSYDPFASSHGGLQYSDSDFTLKFFGPGLDKVSRSHLTTRTAFQTDVAPSVLRYLGIEVGSKMRGKPLFTTSLKPVTK